MPLIEPIRLALRHPVALLIDLRRRILVHGETPWPRVVVLGIHWEEVIGDPQRITAGFRISNRKLVLLIDEFEVLEEKVKEQVLSQGIFEYYRRMAEKLKPPEPVYVRLKAPPGIGAVQTRSGQRTTIGEDRIVEMSAEDADCLIPDGWILLSEGSSDEAG